MKQIGAALANYGKKAVSKITNERQLVLKDFLDQLNPPRIARGMKPLSPGFVGMKMRFMTTSEMKVFFGECKFSKEFGKHWWWRLDVKKQENPMTRETLLDMLRADYRRSDLDALRRHLSMGGWLLTPDDKVKVGEAVKTLEKKASTIGKALGAFGGNVVTNS